jgi:uncharacterized Zn finger protein (UPF0148 family)
MALPCPSCQTPLGITLDFIVKNPMSVCPNCQTVFNFAVSEEIVESFREALQEIEDIKKQYDGSVKFG